jgi:hypothetical protein
MNGQTSPSKTALRIVGILLLCAPVWAQSPETPPPPPGMDALFVTSMGGPGPGADRAVAFVGVEGGLHGKVVTGAPYSAQTSLEIVQVLADGNKIDRTSTGSVARDSEGRVRRDDTFMGFGPLTAAGTPAHVVFINDPVAGVNYVLQPNSKTARKFTPPSKGNANAMGKHAWKGSEDREKETTTVSLGTQSIDGLTVEGTRSTRTIPAGEIGNEKPIQIVVERWYSSDLQTTVKMTRTDPRMGTTIFQLTNINRSEPEASLFQVPADYTVKEGGPMGFHRNGMARPVQP